MRATKPATDGRYGESSRAWQPTWVPKRRGSSGSQRTPYSKQRNDVRAPSAVFAGSQNVGSVEVQSSSLVASSTASVASSRRKPGLRSGSRARSSAPSGDSNGQPSTPRCAMQAKRSASAPA